MSANWILNNSENEQLKTQVRLDYDKIFAIPKEYFQVESSEAVSNIKSDYLKSQNLSFESGKNSNPNIWANSRNNSFNKFNQNLISKLTGAIDVQSQPSCAGFSVDVSCIDQAQFEAQGQTHTIIFNRSINNYPAFKFPIIDATTDSLAAFSTLPGRPVPKTVFIVRNVTHQSVGGAIMSADIFTESDGTNTCQIDIWQSALPMILSEYEEFKQSIAHEFFHCYQTYNFKQQTQGVPWSVADWWGESTAEYFSEFVYPSVNYEHRFLLEFDILSPNRSILEMSYQNYVLFRYIGEVYGDQGVLDVISAMPTTGDIKTQQIALSSFPNISQFFTEFSRAYLQGQISDRSGSLLPIFPVAGTEYSINGAGDFSFVAEPFVVGRGKFLIDSGAEVLDVTVSVNGEPGNYLFNKTLLTPIGGFSEWTETIPDQFGILSCADTDINFYRILLNTTKASPEPFEVTLRVLANPEYETFVDEDALIEDDRFYGNWKLVDGGIERAQDEISNFINNAAIVRGVDASVSYERLASEDSMCFFSKNLMITELKEEYRQIQTIAGQSVTYTTTANTIQRSRYTINNGKMQLIQPTISATGQTIVVSPFGRQVFPITPNTTVDVIEWPYQFISDDELEVTYPIPPYPQKRVKKVS
jgi:hypothetical protein